MTKFETSTGNLEIIHCDDKVLIRLFNKATIHETGITIPKTHVWSFLNRWFFSGKNESLEILVKDDRIVINMNLKFKHEIHISTMISRSTWSKIESEIRG